MFEEWKKEHLRKLRVARERNEVDEDIGGIIDFMNSLDNYYTTSTCSGRITFITVPDSGRKDESFFHHKKHAETSAEAMFNSLKDLVKRCEDDVWFRMEGLIMHVGCRTLEDANKMLSVARLAGLKKSTIFSAQKQVIVEITSSERIDAFVAENGRTVIPEDYFKLLVKKANKKLEQVRRRNKLLLDVLKQSF